jgi:membrane-associated phospholipid phosphatase
VSRSRSREHPLLLNERRDLIVAGVLATLTAVVFVLMAVTPVRHHVQRIDDRFLHLMVDHRTGFVTFVARGFNWLGLTVVTLPVRIAVAGFLSWRRRWWHFTAFVAAMVVSELCVGPVKTLYDRPRPLGSLVTVSGSSFPSGHAIAASVTAVAIVIALFPPRHRTAWGAAAVVFSLLMGLSRAYLAAHWLSDAMAGVLLGTAVAVCTAVVVQTIWDARVRSGKSAPPTRDPVESAALQAASQDPA